MLKKIRDNKIFRIIMAVIRTLITVFLLMLICIIFIQRISNNNFAIGGIRVFTIVTGSMMPEYEVGDMIISIETKPDKIEIGDDIVYQGLVDDFNGKIVTHRVVEKKQTEDGYNFVTKGINNTIEDPKINETQIIGKVIYKTLILSIISKLINNTATFFCIIFIPFVFLVFLEIIEISNEKKNKKEENNE